MTKRVVWISGAGSGMGRASAVAAAGAGWRVVLSGRREDALHETADLVAQAGGESLVLPLDVRGDVPAAARIAVAQWGRLDALVLSAGLNNPKRRWADQEMPSFADIVATNLTGVVNVIDAALPALRESHGVVVVISSYAGWRFSPGAGVAYGASKTALRTVTATLNAEEARQGVSATHLCPADVATDFLQMRPTVPNEAARAVMLSPDDIARTVQFVLDSPAHVRIDELVISPVSQT